MRARFAKIRGWLVTLVSTSLVMGLGTSPLVKAQQNIVPGNAMTVRSDIQEANSKTGVITARGNVQVFYPARKMQATSAQAQYFSRERRLVMTGNVYVLQEGNSIRAETMTYLVDEGRFIATPQTSQQVESIYLVKDNETSPQPAASPTPAPIPSPSLPAAPIINPQ
ncbi:OstA-like protein precursor [Microcystis aeruginosa NIES-3804]|uniref:OstA-like protein n=1 Tax=Microcystis aeruginosa NIES-3804 TaxID=2517783 RepID=A0A6H9GL54_MICAE|nr:LptA/OstA family protein [Microcystis aeruginosa]GCL51184.1 OstA-like protein precursor [Microcystis aeruginosa NIES-3804]